jgi:glycogen phosphorylase
MIPRASRGMGAARPEGSRTGMSVGALTRAVRDHLFYLTGHRPDTASTNDAYLAVAHVVRDRLFARGGEAIDALSADTVGKRVAYLSAEFLMGPQLGANLLNLGIVTEMRDALRRLGLDLYAILDHEEEPGLGNGGLGRLAACYLDSMATLEVPAVGYGIRYEFGIFDQEIRDGWQVEVTDKWLRWGNPWEIPRPESAVEVGFGGRTEWITTVDGHARVRWIPSDVVKGVPHDTPILGYRVGHSNTLRLWRAEAIESFDIAAFNSGDYLRAVDAKVRSETISKVLYPNDHSMQGKALRLTQQFFFVSCSLQDILRLHLKSGRTPSELPDRWALQLNDTHPALAVPELMRLLVDVYGVDWDLAWDITVRTTGYTNHTLMPEALETWHVPLFGSLLPRHLEIVYEINHRLLRDIRGRFPGDEALVARLSLIDERGGRSVRMAHLACAGSHAVNGVATLHTELLMRDVLPGWVACYPERFTSVTNGVTPRRFLALCNPGLAALITSRIGDSWVSDADALVALESLAGDAAFQDEWRRAKALNKVCLAHLVKQRTRIVVDPTTLFDVHVKRIHEYKRQHLNVLHILTLYLRLKASPAREIVPRTFLFGGKAAPAYGMAKRMIRLITAVADLVNHDPDVHGRLTVVFFPDFNVKHAQLIYPAADLSEQISTAGTEASGTGNMKLALNGALTIGTLDGANIEIREAIGSDNFFAFGHTAGDISDLRARHYAPRAWTDEDAELRAVLDLLSSPALTVGQPDLFAPIVQQLLGDDPYMLVADYRSYVDCQDAVSALWGVPSEWTRRAIHSVARMGRFSSDRSVREYCERVWGIPLHTT